MKDRDFFDNWYKNKMETGNESPPEDAWSDISNKLDINSVWDNVNSELNYIEDKRKKRRALAYIILSGITFLLGGYIAFVNLNPSRATEKSIMAERVNGIASTPENSDEENNLNETGVQNQNSSKPIHPAQISLKNNQIKHSNYHARKENQSKSNQSAGHESNSLLFNNETTSDHGINNDFQDTIAKELIDPVYLPMKQLQLGETDLAFKSQLNYDSSIITQHIERKRLSGFYVGALFSGQNPWLWNSETLKGLSKNSMSETVPKFGFSYGVSAGYYYANGFSLQGDFFFDSQYGQTYTGYNEGVYVKEKINLHYYQMNLYTIKRTDTEIKDKNLIISTGPLVGLNFKYLNNATKETNMESNIVKSQYSQFDFGLLFGYEWGLTIKRKYLFFSSVSGDLGFYNIYSGNNSEPKAFNKTFNSSLRIEAGVRYFIK